MFFRIFLAFAGALLTGACSSEFEAGNRNVSGADLGSHAAPAGQNPIPDFGYTVNPPRPAPPAPLRIEYPVPEAAFYSRQVLVAGRCNSGYNVNLVLHSNAPVTTRCLDGRFQTELLHVAGSGHFAIRAWQIVNGMAVADESEALLQVGGGQGDIEIYAPADGQRLSGPATVSGACREALNPYGPVTVWIGGVKQEVNCESGGFQARFENSFLPGTQSIRVDQTNRAGERISSNQISVVFDDVAARPAAPAPTQLGKPPQQSFPMPELMPRYTGILRITYPPNGVAYFSRHILIQGECITGLPVDLTVHTIQARPVECVNGRFEAELIHPQQYGSGNFSIRATQSDPRGTMVAYDPSSILLQVGASLAGLDIITPADGAAVSGAVTVEGRCRSALNRNGPVTVWIGSTMKQVSCTDGGFRAAFAEGFAPGTQSLRADQTDAGGSRISSEQFSIVFAEPSRPQPSPVQTPPVTAPVNPPIDAITPPAYRSCTLDGVTVPHGHMIVGYRSPTDPYNCSALPMVCNDGVLPDAIHHRFASCTVTAPSGCMWYGNFVNEGQHVTGYGVSWLSVSLWQTSGPGAMVCRNGHMIADPPQFNGTGFPHNSYTGANERYCVMMLRRSVAGLLDRVEVAPGQTLYTQAHTTYRGNGQYTCEWGSLICNSDMLRARIVENTFLPGGSYSQAGPCPDTSTFNPFDPAPQDIGN